MAKKKYINCASHILLRFTKQHSSVRSDTLCVIFLAIVACVFSIHSTAVFFASSARTFLNCIATSFGFCSIATFRLIPFFIVIIYVVLFCSALYQITHKTFSHLLQPQIETTKLSTFRIQTQ